MRIGFCFVLPALARRAFGGADGHPFCDLRRGQIATRRCSTSASMARDSQTLVVAS